MKLTINGESREVAAATVLGLLTELGLHPQGTVVERNREIVDREAFRDTRLVRRRRPGTGAPGGGRLMDLAQRLAAFERADLYVVITQAFCAGRSRFGGPGPGSGRRGGNRATPGKGPGRPASFMSWRWHFAGGPRRRGPC